MRIYQKDAARQAVKFPYRNKAPARYRVFPCYRYEHEGRRKNTLQEEVAFVNVADVADFLIRFPGSAVRMMPGRAIVSENIVIDFEEEEPPASTEEIDAPEEDEDT